MLESRNLSVFYGRHRAVENVSVDGVDRRDRRHARRQRRRQEHLPARHRRPDAGDAQGGTVLMDGIDITHRPPHEIVETGIALVPEDRGVFADLTVHENLVLGAHPEAGARRARRRTWSACCRCFPKLAERRKQLVRTMSGGERQMVAVGRAMMSAPSILMLDEPSLGLSPLLCGELFRTLARIKDTGVGIFLVEQNAKQSLAIADRGYLLDNGHIVGSDTAEALSKDEKVKMAYLGGG